MARPKSEDPSHTYTVRMSGTLRGKFEYVAQQKRRKTSELLRLLAEDAVAAYEAAHGPIVLPTPPTTP